MQQTEKYQLNLIEKTDAFSPDALNQNMEKVEAQFDAARAEAAAGDAAVTAAFQAADSALDGRVQFLEAKRVVVGSYSGNSGSAGATQTISLGFTPFALLVIRENTLRVVWEAYPGTDRSSAPSIKIGNGNFTVRNEYNDFMNQSGQTYGFIAFRK